MHKFCIKNVIFIVPVNLVNDHARKVQIGKIQSDQIQCKLSRHERTININRRITDVTEH